MRLLITGANGFIGSALCSKLFDVGHFVRSAVRSKKKITNLKAVESVEVGEVSLTTDWSQALEGVEVIIHLVSSADRFYDKTRDSLSKFRSVNVEGTKCLANAAVQAGIKRFIYISSIKVNGEETGSPYTENSFCAPQDSYGLSKWEAEQELKMISAGTGMEIVILRPPMVYGTPAKSNFLRLVSLIKSGVPLPFACINNRRSMIYLGNLIDAIGLCVKKKEAANQTFLVSDGEDVSTPQLIRLIAMKMNIKPRVIPFPPILLKTAGKFFGKYAEVHRLISSLQIDSSKIRSMLRWKPPFSLEEGIKESVHNFVDMKHKEKDH